MGSGHDQTLKEQPRDILPGDKIICAVTKIPLTEY